MQAMGGLLYESVDPHTLTVKAATDSNGKLECYLEGQSSTFTGVMDGNKTDSGWNCQELFK